MSDLLSSARRAFARPWRVSWRSAAIVAGVLTLVGAAQEGGQPALNVLDGLRDTRAYLACRHSAWVADPHLVGIPSGAVLRSPSIVPGPSGDWVIGALLPAWPVDRWRDTIADEVLFVGAPSGRITTRPAGDFTYLNPRGVVDRASRLHLLWGEPGGAARTGHRGALSLRAYTSAPAMSVWYARHDSATGWTAPRMVYESPRPTPGSHGVRGTKWRVRGIVAMDSAERVHVVFADPTESAALLHLRGDGDAWTTGHVPVRSAEYVDMAIGADDAINVIYTDVSMTAGRSTSRLRLMRSTNAGRDWTNPRSLVETVTLGVYEPRITADDRDRLHVVWRENIAHNRKRARVRHVHSSSRGEHWSSSTDVPVNANGLFDLGLAIAPGRCGGLAAVIPQPRGIRVVRFYGPLRRSTLLHPAQISSELALGRSTDGSLGMLWSAYHPSIPGDSLVRFEPFRMRLGDREKDSP